VDASRPSNLADGYFFQRPSDSYLIINKLRIGAIIKTVKDLGAIDAIGKQSGNTESVADTVCRTGETPQNSELYVRIRFDAGEI